MKDKYVIVDLRNMDYMKNEKGQINFYETEEDAVLTCGMYEFEDAWVMKLIYNHKEPEIDREFRSLFKNRDLSFDIEKIESFDVPITVSKAYDSNLDYPYAIDVEDTSYWYAEQGERDADFEKLKSIVPKFSFVEL